MKVLIAALCVVLMFQTASTFYTKSSGVIEMDTKSFNDQVIRSDDIWIVEFFAPWCGHCQALKPAWEKVAKALKGIVKVGAVDMDANPGTTDIKGFPTIKFYGADKKNPIEYSSGRDEDSIVNYVLNEVKKIVNRRLKGKSDNKSSNKKSGSGRASSEKDVIVLTDKNFNDVVFNSKDIWMIEFYAPWCGHCKKLQPEWESAASKLKGKVKFAKVDATEEKQLASRFGVSSYPTIKYWNYGKDKSDKSALPYQGGREADDLITFAQDLFNRADIDPDIFELNDQKVYDKECNSGVCVIAFLPNIFESSAEARNGYIKSLKKTAKSVTAAYTHTFFWVQAADNMELENSLGLGFGFPAVVVTSPQKKQFGIMKGAFSESGLKSFLDGLMVGKTPLSPLPDNFKFAKTEKWDGKDVEIVEEEFSLDDLDLDIDGTDL